ncbi:hypothetical protein MASR2M15_03470 [Anaerolineales bacterium]
MSIDEMPDFDSMSPEELQRWMETLAKRQGVSDEQLITSADASINTVDESQIDMDSLGEYIPHGWTKERWDAHLAKEAEQKAQAAQSKPVSFTPEIDFDNVPELEYSDLDEEDDELYEDSDEIFAGSFAEEVDLEYEDDADELPDFDSMTPEETQRWLETLAKRQGASDEQLLTSADANVKKVNESDVDMDSLGEYIPHGWTKERWEAHLNAESEKKLRQSQEVNAVSHPAALDDFLNMSDDLDDAADSDELGLADIFQTPSTPATDPKQWLASLADDQTGELPDIPTLNFEEDDPLTDINLDFDLDLDALANLDERPNDPISWLEDLSAGVQPPAPQKSNTPSATLPSFEDLMSGSDSDEQDDTLNWLESLAKEEGASSDEFVTPANVPINMDQSPADSGPGYSDYTFDPDLDSMDLDLDEEDTDAFILEQSGFDDPAAWLDALATSASARGDTGPLGPLPEGFDTEKTPEPDFSKSSEADLSAVVNALNRGEDVSSDDIQQFFQNAFDRAEKISDDVVTPNPDAPAVPSELPDWHMENMVEEPIIEEPPPAPSDAHMDELFGTEDLSASQWLFEDADIDSLSSGDVSDIFADAGEVAVSPEILDELVVDDDDPWVKALFEESQGNSDIEEWYQQQTGQVEDQLDTLPDEEVDLPAEHPTQRPLTAAADIRTAHLPDESGLPLGQQLPDVPNWLTFAAASIPAPEQIDPQLLIEDEPEFDFEDSKSVPVFSLENEEISESVQTENLPEWLRSSIEPEEDIDSVPSWLSDIEEDVSTEDVPSWLFETVQDDSVQVINLPPASEPAPVQPVGAPKAPVQQQQITPAKPRQSYIVNKAVDIVATLNSARSNFANKEIDSALNDYESIVRANANLEEVTTDLVKMSQDNALKGNSSVHRVLGDALMRQGKLEEALATYRKALNLL